jgi:hypothetical protein
MLTILKQTPKQTLIISSFGQLRKMSLNLLAFLFIFNIVSIVYIFNQAFYLISIFTLWKRLKNVCN